MAISPGISVSAMAISLRPLAAPISELDVGDLAIGELLRFVDSVHRSLRVVG